MSRSTNTILVKSHGEKGETSHQQTTNTILVKSHDEKEETSHQHNRGIVLSRRTHTVPVLSVGSLALFNWQNPTRKALSLKEGKSTLYSRTNQWSPDYIFQSPRNEINTTEAKWEERSSNGFK